MPQQLREIRLIEGPPGPPYLLYARFEIACPVCGSSTVFDRLTLVGENEAGQGRLPWVLRSASEVWKQNPPEALSGFCENCGVHFQITRCGIRQLFKQAKNLPLLQP